LLEKLPNNIKYNFFSQNKLLANIDQENSNQQFHKPNHNQLNSYDRHIKTIFIYINQLIFVCQFQLKKSWHILIEKISSFKIN